MRRLSWAAALALVAHPTPKLAFSEEISMKRILIAASALTLVAAGSAFAAALTEQQVEGVEAAIKAIGCTVEETDIMAKGDGYKADDVECKDGNYDMLLDGLQDH
jgi:hypothetical protein